MTNTTDREQPEMSAEAPTPSWSRRQGENDVVERNAFSLTGLEKTVLSPAEEPEKDPAASSKAISTPLFIIVPPEVEQRLRLTDSSEDTKAIPLQSTTHSSSTTDAELPIAPTRPGRVSAAQAALPFASRRATGQIAALLKSIRLRTFMLILLLCILVSGAFAYAYNQSQTRTQIPTRTGVPQSGPITLKKHAPPANPQANNATPGSKSFAVGENASIVLKGYSGNVHIYNGEPGSIVVQVNKDGKNQMDANNTGIQYTQARDAQGHDTISIATTSTSGNINYDISVPRSAQVNVSIDTGTVSINGVSGVIIDSHSGSLDIEDVNGPVNAHIESGNVIVRNINGQIAINAVSGSIKANTANGQLSAITQNGDVIVQQAALSGQTALKTTYGSVRFVGTLDPQGTYSMGTQSGDVDLILPTNAAFQLLAHTNSGTVANEFGGNSVGSGTAHAQIVANIGSGGSIRIHKAL